MASQGWTKLDATFELKSPLHIGYMPSGGSVVARTRPYVPGKRFWGAVTKEATERLFRVPTGKEYKAVGDAIKENFRFSYFFICEEDEVYYPNYASGGLVYGLEESTSKEEFEHRFIESRVLTAVDPSTGTAIFGSLHEVEYIKNRHQDSTGRIIDTQITGSIWLKKGTALPCQDGNALLEVRDDGIFAKGELNLLEGLCIGGEQKYGFGRTIILGVKEAQPGYVYKEDLNGEEVTVRIPFGQPAFSHVKCASAEGGGGKPRFAFKGDIDFISGREYGSRGKRFERPGEVVVAPNYFFAPGTRFFSLEELNQAKELCFEIKYDGTMEYVGIDSGDMHFA